MSPTEPWHRASRPSTGRPGTLRALARDEDGMVSLVTVIAVTMFLILAGMVANIAQTIRAKIVAQNAADSVALSVATVRARGLNAITAANHLIGELQALVVLHHALGAEELDRGDQPPADQAVRNELNLSFEAAKAVEGELGGPDEDIKDDVDKIPKAKATLYDSVIRLQRVLAWTYQAMAVGGALQKMKGVPYVGPVIYATGLALEGASKIYEYKIYLERKILGGLETLASQRPIVELKQALDTQVIRSLHVLNRELVTRGATVQAQAVVESLVEANAVADAASYPRMPALPVRPEPESIAPMERSQLVRATYPWVNHWRDPILRFMRNWLILSKAHRYYHYYTDLYTEQKCREQKQERGIHLLVLEGYDARRADKGREDWTLARGSDLADRLFGVVGAARRPPPRLVSSGIYRQANPDGVVTYAQALTYNANPQRPGSGGATQPQIGWDTLNWGVSVPEFRAVGDRAKESMSGNSVDPKGYPRITLNWQAKLVPVTREQLSRAVRSYAGEHPEIAKALRRALPDATTDQFRTH